MAVPKLTKSAKLYQERKQPDVRTTRRSPAFYHNLKINAVHTLDLGAPYPTAEVKQIEGGNVEYCGNPATDYGSHPPDGALTDVWLHGEEELS